MSGGGVRRIEVTERESPVFGGTEFGAVGPYERLHGTVFGELDPRHPLNAGIVNLDRAARNARVAFSQMRHRARAGNNGMGSTWAGNETGTTG